MSPPFFATSLHPSWCALLGACHDAGFAHELTYAELSRQLAAQGMCVAHPERFLEVLARHYRAGDDPMQAMRRRTRDGFAAVRFGEPMNAMRWLARLVSAAPDLRGLSVQRTPQLSIRSGGAFMRLYDDEGYVELAEVVEAANTLLADRSGERFVPLVATRWSEAYVRLTWPRAAFLDAAELLEPDWMVAFDDVRRRRAA